MNIRKILAPTWLALLAITLTATLGVAFAATQVSGSSESNPTISNPSPGLAADGLTQRIMADGVVTFAEQEEAIAAGVQCMRVAGVDVRLEPAAGKRFSRVMAFRGTATADWVTTVNTCRDDHYCEINRIWASQQSPLDGATRAAEQANMAICLRAAGIPTAADTTSGELVTAVQSPDDRVRQAATDCIRQAEVNYGSY